MPRCSSRRSRLSRRSSRRWGLALAVAALGLGSLSLGAAAQSPRPATHTVVMEAVAFQPAALTVEVGDKIVWVNRDSFPHTATSAAFDSRDIAAGASWTYTATAAGEFPYVCTLHPTMKATLRVTVR
jgi:plastocyanin